jgi:hypothetical protein
VSEAVQLLRNLSAETRFSLHHAQRFLRRYVCWGSYAFGRDPSYWWFTSKCVRSLNRCGASHHGRRYWGTLQSTVVHYLRLHIAAHLYCTSFEKASKLRWSWAGGFSQMGSSPRRGGSGGWRAPPAVMTCPPRTSPSAARAGTTTPRCLTSSSGGVGGKPPPTPATAGRSDEASRPQLYMGQSPLLYGVAYARFWGGPPVLWGGLCKVHGIFL